MGVAVGPDHAACGLVDRALKIIVHDCRVGVVAFVGGEHLSRILGVGISCRYQHVSRSRIAQQVGVALVLPVGFRRHPEDHHRHAAALVVVGESADVQAALTWIPHVPESGSFRDRDSPCHDVGDVGDRPTVFLVLGEDLHHDVVVLGDSWHVALDDPVQDDAVAVAYGRKCGDQLVGGYLVLRPP